MDLIEIKLESSTLIKKTHTGRKAINMHRGETGAFICNKSQNVRKTRSKICAGKTLVSERKSNVGKSSTGRGRVQLGEVNLHLKLSWGNLHLKTYMVGLLKCSCSKESSM